MSEKQTAGRFELRLWLDGHPLSADLKHVEPNGSTAEIRLFGENEFYDLRYVVDRIIAEIEERKRRKT